MHLPSPRSWLCLAAIGVVASTTAAHAEVVVVDVRSGAMTEADFQQARASSNDANEAFGKGQIEVALSHAIAAYRTYPNASTALQVAAIYVHEKNARKAFEWLLRARNHEPSEVLLVRIDKGLLEHGAALQLGVLKVAVQPADAELTVDGTPVKAGLFVGASFGQHAVAVTAEGHHKGERTLEVSAGLTTASLELKAIATEPAVAEPASAGVPAAPLALVISGLVAAGAGAGLHVWGLGAASEAERLNDGRWNARGLSVEQAQAELASLGDQANTGAIVAYALYGVGAALIITGAVLWAMEGSSEGTADADVVVAPAFVPNGGALLVTGGF